MPIPLAMMIPFMAVQSLVMGEAFGKAFQFGKRRISAMTNEEFNKLTLADLISESTQQFKMAIPSIKQSINDSTDLQNRIINEMLLILPKFITGNSSASEEHKHNVASAGITQDSSQSAKWGFMVNDLITKMGKALTEDHTPYAYGTTTPPPETFVPPPFGDQSPPEVFADQPENDPEFVKAKNDLAYRQAQLIKNVTPPKKITVDYNAERRVQIAKSGLSPLATRAINTFKANIDNTELALSNATSALTDITSSPKYPAFVGHRTEATKRRATISTLTKKLGALRVKFKQSYGYFY